MEPISTYYFFKEFQLFLSLVLFLESTYELLNIKQHCFSHFFIRIAFIVCCSYINWYSFWRLSRTTSSWTFALRQNLFFKILWCKWLDNIGLMFTFNLQHDILSPCFLYCDPLLLLLPIMLTLVFPSMSKIKFDDFFLFFADNKSFIFYLQFPWVWRALFRFHRGTFQNQPVNLI